MPDQKKRTFYRFPENMKLFVIALIACNLAVNNFNCNEREDWPVCPVDYQIDEQQQALLKGKWRFIGFENQSTKNIEYPPCGDNEVFLILTDKTADRPEKEIFKYPFIFQGRTLINSYIGSYVTEPGNVIKFSESIQSTVNGTPEIKEFQEKYHHALKNVERFELSNNLLMLHFKPGNRDMLFVAQNDTILF